MSLFLLFDALVIVECVLGPVFVFFVILHCTTHYIDGYLQGVLRGDFDAFMWETFTTKPWFDSGELHKVIVCPIAPGALTVGI